MQKPLAPICLFTYNRLENTIQTIAALKNNLLAKNSDLIIYSDGPKDNSSQIKVEQVRNYLKQIDGFKKIEIIESKANIGLGNSIIQGVSNVINKYGKVIVIEDDLYTTPNFLSYMNQALDFYEYNENIISICGYGLRIKRPNDYTSDFYLYGRSSSWGWATWKYQWDTVDWEVKDWNSFKQNKKAIKAFNFNGSDMYKMLKSVVEGGATSWAIRFGYSQFKQKKYSLMPFSSFVENNGFSNGTNTKFNYSRFKTSLDDGTQNDFKFDPEIIINKKLEKECYKYHSLSIRIYSRLRYIIGF